MTKNNYDSWFLFKDENLQSLLIEKLKETDLNYRVDKAVYYLNSQIEEFEDVLCNVRDMFFEKWQILCVPKECMVLYKKYMDNRDIKYYEELDNGEQQFLLSREYDPLNWEITFSSQKHYH